MFFRLQSHKGFVACWVIDINHKDTLKAKEGGNMHSKRVYQGIRLEKAGWFAVPIHPNKIML